MAENVNLAVLLDLTCGFCGEKQVKLKITLPTGPGGSAALVRPTEPMPVKAECQACGKTVRYGKVPLRIEALDEGDPE